MLGFTLIMGLTLKFGDTVLFALFDVELSAVVLFCNFSNTSNRSLTWVLIASTKSNTSFAFFASTDFGSSL